MVGRTGTQREVYSLHPNKETPTMDSNVDQVKTRVKELIQNIRKSKQPKVEKDVLIAHLNALDAVVENLTSSQSPQNRKNMNGNKSKISRLRERNKIPTQRKETRSSARTRKNFRPRLIVGRLTTTSDSYVVEGDAVFIPEGDPRITTNVIMNEAENCLTTQVPYEVTIGSAQYFNEVEDEEPKSNSIEVPTYREIDLKSGKRETEISYDENGDEEVEDLKDDTFLKRHQKLEIAERRRKRWDSQRLREESYLDKLKRNQESGRRETYMKRKHQNGNSILDCVGSLLPSAEDAEYIRVQDDVVISAFGCPLPIIEPEPFSLPWKPYLRPNFYEMYPQLLDDKIEVKIKKENIIEEKKDGIDKKKKTLFDEGEEPEDLISAPMLRRSSQGKK